MERARLLIGGKWLESDVTSFDINPATGDAIALVDIAQPEHVSMAVSNAHAALASWRMTDISSRAVIVSRAADLLLEEYGEPNQPTALKELIGREVGKRLPEADIEVVESADMLRHFASVAPSVLRDRDLSLDESLWPTKRSKIQFEPVGVVAVIKPWNYPLELPLWTIGPALLCGNTIVFKSSEHSPLVAAFIGRLFADAGLPPGVLNVISGGPETGRSLVSEPFVNMVSFTGSVAVGREIASACGNSLKRCCLELGGNDPALVLKDADLDLTANGLVWGAFANSGQVCVRPKRVFVESAIAKVLIEMIVERTSALRKDVDYGPVISAEQRTRVEEFVEDAVARGAIVSAGGTAIPANGGHYIPPVVLTNVSLDSRLMKEECFGPVMPIIEVADATEAITLANGTEFGLGASIWTRDLGRANELASKLEAGMVWINDVNVAFPQAPWGGVKASGLGAELSEWGFYEYSLRKHVNHDVSSETRRAWWYPY